MIASSAILSIIAYLLPFLLEGLKKWQDDTAAREAKTYANDKPKFDQALVARDTGTMSAMFTELCPPPDYNRDSSGQDNQVSAKR